ncbi:MAG TPA: L,D-transpeptidase family protein [Anaerolineales bacterium]
MHGSSRISRRDFMKLAGLGIGALALNPRAPLASVQPLPQFPAGDRLGRVAVTPNFYSTQLKSRPDENAPKIRDVGQDEVVVWQREVVGTNVMGRTNTRWVETPDGFIYAVDLQPVRNLPNTPITGIPQDKKGFWAEVTVPYVDLSLQNPPISPGVKYLLSTNQRVRLYYGQVAWIDAVGSDASGNILYRFDEAPQHGSGYGDIFVAEAAAFHPLTNEDVAPITPNVDPATKKIVIDATQGRQTLSCFEGNSEVYFCRVSTGFFSSAEDDSTPTGDQAISWKTFSIHMAANTVNRGGYDTMAVPWPVYFNQPAGAAIHGAFWHNDFGVRRSHGCVNVSPEDAKWIFRWTNPFLSLDQSEWRETDWTKVGKGYSTSVTVNETKA